MGGKQDDNSGLYRDYLIDPFYIYRPEDPKTYGYICPHCSKRWGEEKVYIDIERCADCPPYFPGMEISWTITKSVRAKLKELGYFKQKSRGGKKKSAATQTR
jgi:hypothetical protein